ncbi:hypothetical protein [Agreia sp. COWG]|uniref:alginate O-acetyltransferase AlgX-related protein n=1 Tax=Agreia sp. COWG TaxID=2773266 RepID=UPI0019283B2C|nr:hypothetical protein [Agreia sp. COWG]CAD5993305.1 ALGX domain-containing protein [Agreia sp. COWG]
MSDDGLRVMPPSQAPLNRRGLLVWYRYIPLAILTVAVLLAGGVGFVIKHQTPVASPAGASVLERSLPEVCSPGVDQKLAGEPWADPARTAESEATFQKSVAGADPLYIPGKDGWAFWNDYQINDLSQSMGRVSLDQAGTDAWASYFAGLKATANERGSSFYVVIAPAKWDVYPQKMADWAQDLRGTVSFDRLLAAHPEIPLIDTRAALRAASAENDTYSPLDSHWTGYGGYVAWDAITTCLGANDPGLAGISAPPITGVSAAPDHNEYADRGVVASPTPDWTFPEYAEPHAPTTVTSLTSGLEVPARSDNVIDLTELPVESTTTGAQSDLNLLVIRDSTSGSLSPLMTESFAHTVMYSHNVGAPDRPLDVAGILDAHPTNVTLFVMTERYLAFGPPSAG